jgi:pimeloyl-ACP methyl ester carboxylesterase
METSHAVDHKYFDSAGVQIRYAERGTGEPVVLVHSYTSDLEDQWVKPGTFGELSRHYRTIAFDVRGHGQSAKPHDPQAYGPEMARDVARLLDHLAIPKAHIVGYSMGAHIVAQLLVLNPERFLTAVLGGACGRHSWTADDELRAEIEAAEMEQGRLTSQILRLWPGDQPTPGAAELEALSQKFLVGGDCRALAAIRRSNKDQVITLAQLAAVQVPVLGVVAGADPYLARFAELSQLAPRLQLVIINDATHASAAGKPEFVRAIRNFISAHHTQSEGDRDES